jgi:hypothetical protein
MEVARRTGGLAVALGTTCPGLLLLLLLLLFQCCGSLAAPGQILLLGLTVAELQRHAS